MQGGKDPVVPWDADDAFQKVGGGGESTRGLQCEEKSCRLDLILQSLLVVGLAHVCTAAD